MKHKWIFVLVSLAIALSAWGAMPTLRARAQATAYTWNQTGTAAWTTATNWTPTRITPAVDDILQFNSGGSVTVTGVPVQTIGQLLISNSTTVNLQAGAANNTLTVAGNLGTDLDVPNGSALNVNGSNALTILVGSGATGRISGSALFMNAAHRLTANDASGITFSSGAVLTQGTGCTGSIFNTTRTANVVVFESGSTFVSQAGANPFGLTAPNSKVVFQTGSLYRYEQNGTPSFSGRTYVNFELNFASASHSGTGGGSLSIDNLTVTAGTLNMGMTGIFNLRGNISVALGAVLNFNPASVATITLNGTSSQSISGAGTLTFSANETVAINNASGVVAQRNVVFSGPLTINASAALNANGNTVTAGTLTNNGTITQNLTVNGSSDVGFFNTGGYGGVVLNANGSDLGSTTVTIKGNHACNTGVNQLIHRCFNISPASKPGVTRQ